MQFISAEFTGFSVEIGATVVGIITVYIIGRQFDQHKLNQRIADMQYAKLMEDRLLGILYGNEFFHEFDPRCSNC